MIENQGLDLEKGLIPGPPTNGEGLRFTVPFWNNLADLGCLFGPSWIRPKVYRKASKIMKNEAVGCFGWPPGQRSFQELCFGAPPRVWGELISELE